MTQGRKFDGDGKLNDWWTPEDEAKFNAAGRQLAAQFDKFEPVTGYFINGKLTAGENIADLGGLLIALDAYHAALGDKEAPRDRRPDRRAAVLSGLCAELEVENDATRRPSMQIKSDEHAPEHFRVNGPVRNIDAWYTAFDIKPGDPMYVAPDKRVRIW